MGVISRLGTLSAAALLTLIGSTRAGVLPEDRADYLYHSYDGGDVEVTGPSILVRKGDARRFSASANYYTDSISSASIDVVVQGSEYSEQRTQYSASLDYLHADTIMTAGYTNSDETDYKADTYNFSIAQSMFGGLTTVTIGYSYGNDDISSNVDDTVKETADHRNYHLSLSQVLTKSMILSLNYDTITDEGFLNNPYRHVQALNDPFDPTAGTNFNTPEVYPNTRTSNAVSANLLYYLPYRAALRSSYRYYTDDWDIDAHTAEIAYTHPLHDKWVFEVNYRFYTQSDADFYADVFVDPSLQNFVARDKELSKFKDHTLGFGVSYNFLSNGFHFIDKASLNARYSHIWFQYDNFTDVTESDLPDYEFEADVIQLYISAWY